MATLRAKTLTIIYTVTFLGGVFLYFTTNLILSQSFARLEEQAAQENLQRVLNAVALEEAELSNGLADWSNWDDTYAFVQNANTTYVETNLGPSTFANLHLNLMLFVNSSGSNVFARSYNAQAMSTEDVIPVGFASYLSANSPLLRHPESSSIVGIILLPESPMLVASRPILNSNGEGPSAGTLIWGRYLDSAEIARLADAILLPISLYSLDNLPPDFETANDDLSLESPAVVRLLDEQTAAGYALLTDINRNPILMLRVDIERDITQVGQAATVHFFVAVIVTGLLAGIAALFLLGRMVLAPLMELNQAVTGIRNSGDLSARMPIQSRDEIASLASSINDLLESLQSSQTALETLNHDLEARVTDRTASSMRTKEHVEAILNNSSDAILLSRADGVIRQTNPAFNHLFGYRADEMFGQKLNQIALHEHSSPLMDSLSKVVQKRQPRRLEITAHRKDGTTFEADIALAPIIRTNPDSIEVICSLRDITERKRMEMELRETLHKQKELNEFKSRFTSMISHEFRTPLTTILSSSQLLQRYTDKLTNDKKRSHFQKIETSVRHLTEMLDDVLALSKAEALASETTREMLNLEILCRAMVEEIQQGVGTKHHIIFHAGGEPAYLSGNEKLLRQAIGNLLSNAVKYSPYGGEINVELRCEDSKVRLRVQDHGIGIPKEQYDWLFTDFHRANNVGTISGTGLGLVIIKRAVEAHGGTITFDSEVGAGTTFTVTLPLMPVYSGVSGGSV